MRVFIAEIGVTIYFYVGNKVKQKKAEGDDRFLLFFDIIFDDSIGGLVVNVKSCALSN